MPVTAEKPVTQAEFDERMALAKQYGPVAVANLAEEFRRRVFRPETGAENAFGFSDLRKCGLEAPVDEPAVTIVGDGRLSKRKLNTRDQKRLDEIAKDRSRPPTPEEQIELLRLTALPGEEEEVEKIIALNFGVGSATVTKSYTPTSAQIAKHDEPLADSAGI